MYELQLQNQFAADGKNYIESVWGKNSGTFGSIV